MVIRWALILATLLAPAASAEDLQAYHPEPNHPAEDFFVVSIISLPFTALWCLVGATAVASVSQQKFPPDFTDEALIGAGAVALGSSVSIGLLSVSWGGSKSTQNKK